jgi:hypothetical protein
MWSAEEASGKKPTARRKEIVVDQRPLTLDELGISRFIKRAPPLAPAAYCLLRRMRPYTLSEGSVSIRPDHHFDDACLQPWLNKFDPCRS